MKKIIVLGVSGGIAVYKSAQLASNLFQKGYDVHVIMTKNATEFVTPLTFEVLTNNKVAVDTFDRNFDDNVNHIGLAKKADLFVVAPATANVMAKFAAGVADDMLTTAYLSFRCPTLIAPAMNTAMFEHIATKRNIAQLKADGAHFVAPGSGYLACGDVGEGRLAELDDIEAGIDFLLQKQTLLQGKKVVITGGPTIEPLDPVRFLSNHSSGKMGYALAEVARDLGADVVLVTGPTALKKPHGVETVAVQTADEMYERVMAHLDFDLFVGAAAVSDYKPSEISNHKLKKRDLGTDLTVMLTMNKDIVGEVAKKKKGDQVVCAFAMETENLVERAKEKLLQKQVDMVVANHLLTPGAGFKTDTNQVTLIKKEGVEQLELMSKKEVAVEILKRLLEMV